MKGQASVEALLLLSASLVVTLFFLSVAISGYLAWQSALSSKMASYSLDVLEKACYDVIYEGDGSSRIVYLLLPEDFERGSSYISHGRIFINTSSGSFGTEFPFDVRGEFPEGTGRVPVLVLNDRGRVRVQPWEG